MDNFAYLREFQREMIVDFDPIVKDQILHTIWVSACLFGERVRKPVIKAAVPGAA